MTAANPTLWLTQWTDHSAHERRPQGCARPDCPEICSHRVAGSNDDSGRSPRVSCACENPGWHAWCPGSILASGKQSDRNSKGLGRDGATGALAERVNLHICHRGSPESPNPRFSTIASQSVPARFQRHRVWRPGAGGMILTFEDELLTNTVSMLCPRCFATAPRQISPAVLGFLIFVQCSQNVLLERRRLEFRNLLHLRCWFHRLEELTHLTPAVSASGCRPTRTNMVDHRVLAGSSLVSTFR